MDTNQIGAYLDEFFDCLERDFSSLLHVSFSDTWSGVLKSRFAAAFQCSSVEYYTKLLPLYGKKLDRALGDGYWETWYADQPLWAGTQLGYLLDRIFDSDGYTTRDDFPTRDCRLPLYVKLMRQALYFAYKLELPYTKAQEQAVISRFLANEEELHSFQVPRDSLVLSYARQLITDLFQDFDPEDIMPGHGPGAVSTGEKLEQKWEFSRLYPSIESVYPYLNWYFLGYPHASARIFYGSDFEEPVEGLAKVSLVPKDSRGPRLISCEPLEYMWMQQGLGRAIMRHTESREWGINFTSQSFNQDLALSSSISGDMATLDLEDASDRVSLALVEELFADVPHVLRALKATRTSATVLPDGTVVRQAKFAPMGSATCFPVEACVFWALTLSALVVEGGMKRKRARTNLLVYGDDIIVPTEHADAVMRTLEHYGLKVNHNKSFKSGGFRESCGMDAWFGARVTPVRLRSLPPSRKDDTSAIASMVALANALQQEDYGEAAACAFFWVESIIGELPYGTFRASYLCRVVSDAAIAEGLNIPRFAYRYNRHTFQKEFNFSALVSRKRELRLNGWSRLLRNLTSGGGDEPSSQTLPRSIQLRRRWVSTH